MQSNLKSEQILNLKCPACGHLTPKHLSDIQSQRSFDCDCGFHADLNPEGISRLKMNHNEHLTETA